jgi:hypothetical protein
MHIAELTPHPLCPSQTSNLKATGVHTTKSEGSREGANEPGSMSDNTKPGESPSLAADVAKVSPGPFLHVAARTDSEHDRASRTALPRAKVPTVLEDSRRTEDTPEAVK